MGSSSQRHDGQSPLLYQGWRVAERCGLSHRMGHAEAGGLSTTRLTLVRQRERCPVRGSCPGTTTDAGEAVGGRPEPSADLLRQLDDDPRRAADVAEPIAVFVALHLANELRAAGSQASDASIAVTTFAAGTFFMAVPPVL